jgi:branched-chain amino acid transport system substrate-binding protein
MRRATVFLGVLAAALAVALPVAVGGSTAEPGLTSGTILIGGTAPLSGVAAAYASVARGAEAYFKYQNARGGVNRRKINYKYLNDEYNPSSTVQQTRQLVQSDRVFAIFNSLGTEHNLAIRDYLNSVRVPQLFAASGARTFGAEYRRYPWTIGFQPSYRGEARIYGRWIVKNRPRARIAILYQNDDYGKELNAGLRQGLGRRAGQIVSTQSYEVTASDVQSQIARLKSSGANTLMVFATPRYAIQAFVYANNLRWRPLVFVNSVSSASNIMNIASESGRNPVANGALSIAFVKDPTDPKWRRSPGMRLYRQIMKRHNPRGNVNDLYHVYSMAVAHTTVEVLRMAGRNPTRASVMAAASRLNSKNNPFLLPGIVVKTSRTDRFPIEQVQMQRWRNGSNGHWNAFGGLVRSPG